MHSLDYVGWMGVRYGYNSGLSMRRVNELVQYDFDRNTFYKIDKATGVQSPTYKTGEDLKRFRPDVTGHSYLIRRKSQRVQAELQKPLLVSKERSFRTERTIPPEYSYFKTLETSRRDSKPTEASVLMRSTINNRRDQSPPVQRRQNSLIRPRDEEQERQQEGGSKALLNQTLTSYTRLLKEKPRENHSPRRDQYEGSQTARDPLDTLCTTLSHFRTKEPQWDQPPSPARPQGQIRASIQSSPKETNAKERSLFLEFHPELVTAANPTRIEAQVQRKRNLKILEELFIRQGNRLTRRPYSNTPTPT